MSRAKGLGLVTHGLPMIAFLVLGSVGLAELQRTKTEQIDQRNGSIASSERINDFPRTDAYAGRGDVNRLQMLRKQKAAQSKSAEEELRSLKDRTAGSLQAYENVPVPKLS
mmetsp:Transcript_1879/g.6727  ORF Transcript_1879/g.6727 Transcript_1879/m.6727 type:complete len:111 (-) Transcript_1879:1238-1570(-)|eukprot:scaffold5277_cov404-Prasinococcus_capsulatus_cf.AAC.13